MTEIMRELYYMVDDWAGQHESENSEAKELMARREALLEQIILRLGGGGRDLMDALSNLNLELEDIHNEALFRAAMQLGTQIARPGRGNGRPGASLRISPRLRGAED